MKEILLMKNLFFNIMNFLLSFFFSSLFASFGGFIAFDYFATPTLHGIINGEILFFLTLWSLPRNCKLKFFLLLCCAVSLFFFNPVVGTYSLCAVLISFIKRNSKQVVYFLACIFFVFSVFFDSASLIKDSFMMNISQFWKACSFFWWGILLFILVPLANSCLIVFFSRKVICEAKPSPISPITATLIITITLFANYCFTTVQSRMLLVDFPVYRYFQDYNMFKSFDVNSMQKNIVQEESLCAETKAVFKIWEFQDSILLKKKTVYVLVESYGVHKDTTIAKEMIFKPFKGYNPTFIGILSRHAMYTQGAELEDLGNADYHDSTEIPLISNMKKNHIEAWYIHGYEGSFYSRKIKYKQYGFDSLLFIDELQNKNAQTCNYGFEGVCDTFMVSVLDSILSRSGDKFIYWTTLDTHPPYKSNINLPSYSVFCKNLSISDKMCTYLSLIENTLKSVAKLSQKHPDYQFVIRGDHRPMGTIDPNDFYYAWVPMIILN